MEFISQDYINIYQLISYESKFQTILSLAAFSTASALICANRSASSGIYGYSIYASPARRAVLCRVPVGLIQPFPGIYLPGLLETDRKGPRLKVFTIDIHRNDLPVLTLASSTGIIPRIRLPDNNESLINVYNGVLVH